MRSHPVSDVSNASKAMAGGSISVDVPNVGMSVAATVRLNSTHQGTRVRQVTLLRKVLSPAKSGSTTMRVVRCSWGQSLRRLIHTLWTSPHPAPGPRFRITGAHCFTDATGF